MGSAQETSIVDAQNMVSPTQDADNEVSSKGEGGDKIDADGAKLSTVELFPWILEFKKLCRRSLAQRSMFSLTKLMKYYSRNVSLNVNECYAKPIRAAKLKESISETLLFFLYYYREVSEANDRSVYLNEISDLLAMYMDMELKASRRGKEQHGKITARLTSCLYIYLENSTEHLLDTLIKVRFMSRNYHNILDPIITKVFKDVPVCPISDVMYVRHLLAYRLWKKVNNDAAVKNQINATAISSLGSPPTVVTPFLAKHVLPRIPKSQENSAKFLLTHKFDVEKSCKLFVQFCKDTRDNEAREGIESTELITSASSSDSSKMMGGSGTSRGVIHLDDTIDLRASAMSRQIEFASPIVNPVFGLSDNEATIESSKLVPNGNESGKDISSEPLKSTKVLLRRRKPKKTSEIVLIDLTCDEVMGKVIKRRKRKKIAWLKDAKKQIDMKAVKAARKKEKIKRMISGASVFSDIVSKSTRQPDGDFQSLPTLQDLVEERTPNVSVTSYSGIAKDKLELNEPLSSKSNDITCKVARIPAATSHARELDSNNTRLLQASPSIRQALASMTTPRPSSECSNALNNISTYYDSDSAVEASSDENSNGISTREAIEKTKSSDKTSENIVSDATTTLNSKSKGLSRNIIPEIRSNDKPLTGNHAVGRTAETKCLENGTANELNARNLDDTADNTHVIDDRSTDFSNSSLTMCKGSPRIESPKLIVATEKSKIEDVGNEIMKSSGIPEGTASTCSDATLAQNSEMSEIASESNGAINDVQHTLSRNGNNNIVQEKPIESESICEVSTLNLINSTILNPQYYQDAQDVAICSTPKELEIKSNVIAEQNQKVRVVNGRHEIYGIVDSARLDDRGNGLPAEDDNGNTGKNIYSTRVSDFQENIDGLSLLASVSQQVPHLKSTPRPECLEETLARDQVEAWDYSTPKNVLANRDIDEETAADSSSTVIRLCENPSTEIINEIIGIYPEDALERVAFQVEVTSTESADSPSAEKNPFNVEPAVVESTTDLDEANMPQNNVLSMDNANVILNGETIVLLQRSPNSNLYIINKAVENCKSNRTGDEESSGIKDESSIAESPFSSALHDTMNCVPSNLELSQCDKVLIRRDNKSVLINGALIKAEPKEESELDIDYGDLARVASLNSRCKVSQCSKKAEYDFARETSYDISSSAKEIKPAKINLPPVVNSSGAMLSSQHFTERPTARQDPSLPGKTSAGKRKRKSSKSSAICRQSIKQECNACANNVHQCTTCDYGIQESRDFIEPSAVSTIYGAVPASTDLYMPYHKHCPASSRNLQVGSAGGAPAVCAGPHCSCLACTYGVIAHCRQCVHPATERHSSYVQTNSYCLSAHPSVQPSVVQSSEKATTNEAVLAKVYDDQLLRNAELNTSDGKSLEGVDLKCYKPENKYRQEMANKLPLKKRHKAQAMIAVMFDESPPIKVGGLENYPGTPMISIAALEAQDASRGRVAVSDVKSPLDSAKIKDDSSGNPPHTHHHHHYSTEMIRRDYRKDTNSALNSHQNHVDEGMKKQQHEHHRCQTNGQSGNTAACHPQNYQLTFKTPAQRKKVIVASQPPLERLANVLVPSTKSPKKMKKMQSGIKQTRSSKRNIPKVNYSFPDVDPEWNPTGESKRKRKKTNR